MPITRIFQSSKQMEEFEDFMGSEMQPFVSILQEKNAETVVAEPISVDGTTFIPQPQLEKTRKSIFWHRIITLFDKDKNKLERKDIT